MGQAVFEQEVKLQIDFSFSDSAVDVYPMATLKVQCMFSVCAEQVSKAECVLLSYRQTNMLNLSFGPTAAS